MMSFLDSVHIKGHSTSYDDIEITPSNDQGVEMTLEASTEGKQSSMVQSPEFPHATSSLE